MAGGFTGADTDSLRMYAESVVRRTTAIEEVLSSLRFALDSVEWEGEDADGLRGTWRREIRPDFEDCIFELRLMSRRLLAHAEEQDAAAASDGAGGYGGLGGLALGGALGDTGASSAQAMQALLTDLLGAAEDPMLGMIQELTGIPAALLDALMDLAGDDPLARLGLLSGFLSALFGPQLGGLIGSLALGTALLQELMAAIGLSALIGGEIGLEPLGDSGLESGTGRGDDGATSDETAAEQPQQNAAGGGSGGGSEGGSGGGSGGGGEATGGGEQAEQLAPAGPSTAHVIGVEGAQEAAGSLFRGSSAGVDLGVEDPKTLFEQLLEAFGLDGLGAGMGARIGTTRR